MRKRRFPRQLPQSGLLLIFLALLTLAGCQGLSAGGGSSSKPDPKPASGSLALSTATLNFGNVVVGSNNTLTVTATNNGDASLTVSSATSSNKQFALSTPSLPATIAAGQSTTLSVVYTPSAAGNVSATLTIANSASNASVAVSLSGIGIAPGQLNSNATTLNFGNVLLGKSGTQSAVLTNAGGSSVTISQANISGSSGFQVTGLNLPLTLNSGQTATLNVTFTPQSSGAASGSISLTSTASMSDKHAVRLRMEGFANDTSTLVIQVNGEGTTPGVLGASPSSLNFVNVVVGSNSSQGVTVTNSGGSNATISQAIVTGAGFSVNGLTLPLTLTPGQSTGFNVVFAPQSAGTISGNVALTSDASNSTLNIPLSGISLPPGALTVSPTSLSFGTVIVGSNRQLPATLTNTGGASVTVTQANVSGAGFSMSGFSLPLTLTAGQQAGFTVTFTPSSAGNASGNVTFTSNAPNPTLVLPLSGVAVLPGTLSPNPSSLNFGNVQVGNNKSLNETVTNTGGASLTISQVNVSGTGFSVSGITPPVTLTPNQSYTFTATFTPASAGSASGNITVVSNASNPSLSIGLSGNGTAPPPAQLAVSPTTLSFGNVVVGTNRQLGGQLNASNGSVTVTSAVSSNSQYVFSGLTLPVTIPAGSYATFNVTFTPTTSGQVNATLTFYSNASNSPTVESLTGNGTSPPSHTVSLQWDPSSSPNINGYNIYRSTNNGGPYSKINPSLNSTTSYSDNSVVDGTTYYYVTTAVNTSNQESGYSNQATAVIPPP